jgi:soluble lytic murein transglycosylase-like protein
MSLHVTRLMRPLPLLTLLVAALVALACASPSPAPPATDAKAAAPVMALVPRTEAPGLSEQLPSAPPASSEPEEEAAEDPTLALTREVLAARAPRIAEPQREGLARTLVEIEREGGPSALLVVALIEQESRFNPRARGPRGALGLMQVRPFVGQAVAARMGVPWRGAQTLLDPVANVRIGAGYLAELRARFGSWALALAAYNMGPSRLSRRIARGNERSPAFVSRVLRDYEGLQQEFAPSVAGIGG